jgi:glycogen(starch) synthase
LRILLAPSAYAPRVGGIEEVAARLAAHLVAESNSVEVLTNRWPADLPTEEIIAGVTVRRIDMPAPGLHPGRVAGYPAAAAAVRAGLDRLAGEFQPDVIHAIGASWQAHHTSLLARRRRVPFVLSLAGEVAADDHDLYRSGLRSVLVKAALRKVLRHAAAVTGCSRLAIAATSRVVPVTNAEVIGNGIAVAEFAGIPPARAGGPVLAFGRLVPVKGFDLLLRAWEHVAGLELWIGGEGPALGSLQAMAAQFQGRVLFLGGLDRVGVLEALSACSAVVMPSRFDAFGIVALEGMAAGRPVVASSLSGAAEFLRGGLLVDPNNPHALAAAIHDATSRPELGMDGRAAVAAHDWAVVGRQYEDLYRRVAA